MNKDVQTLTGNNLNKSNAQNNIEASIHVEDIKVARDVSGAKTNGINDDMVSSDLDDIKGPNNVNDVRLSNDVNDIKIPNRVYNTQESNIKHTDVAKLKREDIAIITEKLRDRISNSSRSATPRDQKREKNVAIAALLRLHSIKPASENRIKLYPPEYFEKSPKDHDFQKNLTDEKNTKDFDEKNNLTDSVNVKTESTTTKIEETSASPSKYGGSTSPDSVKTPQSSVASDPAFQESIKKVNDWLGVPKSPSPKTPFVHLGPVTFKKKGTVTSPCKESPKKETSEKHYTVPQYKPKAEIKIKLKSSEEECTGDEFSDRIYKELKKRDTKIIGDRVLETENGNGERGKRGSKSRRWIKIG